MATYRQTNEKYGEILKHGEWSSVSLREIQIRMHQIFPQWLISPTLNQGANRWLQHSIGTGKRKDTSLYHFLSLGSFVAATSWRVSFIDTVLQTCWVCNNPPSDQSVCGFHQGEFPIHYVPLKAVLLKDNLLWTVYNRSLCHRCMNGTITPIHSKRRQ